MSRNQNLKIQIAGTCKYNKTFYDNEGIEIYIRKTRNIDKSTVEIMVEKWWETYDEFVGNSKNEMELNDTKYINKCSCNLIHYQSFNNYQCSTLLLIVAFDPLSRQT